jgi:hypothetical protein
MLLTALGMIVYIVVPRQILNGKFENAAVLLYLIYLISSIALQLIVSLTINYVSRLFVTVYCSLSSFFGKHQPEKYKPLIFKNMDAHESSNYKISLTFISIIAFMMKITVLSQMIMLIF